MGNGKWKMGLEIWETMNRDADAPGLSRREFTLAATPKGGQKSGDAPGLPRREFTQAATQRAKDKQRCSGLVPERVHAGSYNAGIESVDAPERVHAGSYNAGIVSVDAPGLSRREFTLAATQRGDRRC
jgi:hypothetical protein